MPTTTANGRSREEDRILTNAHGTVMVIGWMILASTVHRKTNRVGLIVIMSLWSAWVVIIVVLLEIVRLYLLRMSSMTVNRSMNNREFELANTTLPPTVKVQQAEDVDSKLSNNMILIFLFVHMIVAIALATPLIVSIWH
ncbi:unnamed protein product [Rotaria sp. Silwood2]|nr:unnamed protein product [Rotaria sp. Silwood2]CAF3033414.1 unnamed protein product [Rotaria sp. Silwood2]CAF4438251.1 unnamed protein product [Rotaria sp. Silwood2]